MKPLLLVVAGPTAVGKTAVAIELARHFKTEIISADSRQFYRDMSIGTAKPSLEERQGIPHHFMDFLPLEEEFPAGRFEKEVLEKLEELFKVHKVVILAGGSGLFIRAVCDGMDEMPPTDPEIRTELEKDLREKGLEHLQEKLRELDPEFYEIIDLKNPHRLLRALEVCLSTGQPYSSLRSAQSKERPFNSLKIGLTLDREILYDRINNRVDLMIDQGLEAEVKSLLQFQHLNSLNTVGYREWFEYFGNHCSRDEVIELIKRNTRRYAKRQMTWLRKEKDMHWFSPTEKENILKLAETAVSTASTAS